MTTDICTGGCLCGAIRYAVTGDPVETVYCHCAMCRRASGAPMVAWAMFAEDRVEFTGGSLAVYASSPGARRTFCANCGTQIGFTADYMPGLVDITVGSLDAPEARAPRLHIWTASRLPWLEISDALPRHAELPDWGS